MVELRLRAQRIGDDIAFLIPAAVAEAEGILEGQVVQLRAQPLRRGSLDVVGKYRGIGAFDRSDVGWRGGPWATS